MSISLVANTAKGASPAGNTTTTGIDTTGADFIVAVIADFQSAVPSLTDSKSNVWDLVMLKRSGASQLVAMYVSYPTSVGSSHTFTTATASFPAIAIAAFSGMSSQFGSAFSTTNVFTRQPGTVALAQATGLLITGICVNAITTLTIDDSFSISDQVAVVGGAHEGVGLAYRIVSTGTHSPTWTLSTSTTVAAVLAGFGGTASGSTGGGSYGFA